MLVTVRADLEQGGARAAANFLSAARRHRRAGSARRPSRVWRFASSPRAWLHPTAHPSRPGSIRPAFCRARPAPLDGGESALEFHVGRSQGAFRVDAEMPREVDDRKQQIADLAGDLLAVAGRERALRSRRPPHGFSRGPVRVRPSRSRPWRPWPAASGRGSGQAARPERPPARPPDMALRIPRGGVRPLGLLGCLDPLPEPVAPRPRQLAGVAEHMGMAAHQLRR